MRYPRYPAYKDSGVEWLGEVPAHWNVQRQRNVADVLVSNVDKHAVEGEQSVRLCNYVDVYKNERITSAIPFMSATATTEEVARFGLQVGDVIITKDSESRTDIGVPALVEYSAPDLLCGYHLAILRARIGILEGSYMFRALQSQGVQAQYHVSANGITRYGLSHDAVKNAMLPIPPLPEQAAIAAFLDRETARLDALIARQEQLIALLHEKRQALISHAVTKGLCPDAPMKDSGVEWLGEIPAHWETKQLRHCTRILRGKFSHRPRNDPEFYDGDYPFIQTGDIVSAGKYLRGYNQTLNEKGRAVSKEFPRGTLVMAIAANIGDAAILDFPAYFPDSIVGMVPNEHVLTDFLLLVLHAMRQELVRTATINTQMNINVEQISPLKIGLPGLDEQRRIVCAIEQEETKLNQLIAKAEHAIALLREHRTALIAAAVTGKIDVREAVIAESAAPLAAGGAR